MTGGKWERRLERASELAATHPFAAEGLRFYERIATFQRSLYESLEAAAGAPRAPKKVRAPGTLRDEFELLPLLPWFASFLGFVAEVAPPPLARAAAELSS